MKRTACNERDQLTDWLVSKRFDIVCGYVLGRYGIVLDADVLGNWFWLWLKKHGYLGTDTRMWLKFRLIEHGYLPAGKKGCPEIRLTVLMHSEAPMKPFDAIDTVNFMALFDVDLRRPVFFRKSQYFTSGIDETARRTGVEFFTRACPYCRRRFHDAEQMDAHVKQSHKYAKEKTK